MIRRIANFVSDLPGFLFLTILVFGVGALGYVAVMWTMHLMAATHYVYAAALGIVAVLVTLFATLRVPLAQFILLGAAIVVGVAFATGTQNILLP